MDQPGTRIQWGQALVVLSMIVLSWWTATQWTAWELAFQPELGRPWFMVLHRWPVYAPPLFFWWWYEFDAYAPAVFARGAWIAGSGGVLAFMAAVALSVHRAREAKRAATYGSARWAEDAEIRAAGLLGVDGVVLGKYRWAYLRHDGPEHVLIFAPTRTGKGVGMVIPTLLTWPGSAIIHDIKGENWQITAGFRATFGRVLLFDPTNPASSAYNPLLEVRRGASEVRDVQNIADILVDPEGWLERRNHWEKTSHGVLLWDMVCATIGRPCPKSVDGDRLTSEQGDFNRTPTIGEALYFEEHQPPCGMLPTPLAPNGGRRLSAGEIRTGRRANGSKAQIDTPNLLRHADLETLPTPTKRDRRMDGWSDAYDRRKSPTMDAVMDGAMTGRAPPDRWAGARALAALLRSHGLTGTAALPLTYGWMMGFPPGWLARALH